MWDELETQGAVAAVLVSPAVPDPNANDIWPEVRDPEQCPPSYYLLSGDSHAASNSRDTPFASARVKSLPGPTKLHKTTKCNRTPNISQGWPPGRLPTELYGAIADHLSRDDIKSMRLVCHEFNDQLSQVLFETAVVPFNMEIYGMLEPEILYDGRDPSSSKFIWMNPKNSDIYNGHGLDVFRGFGRHIRRFGMSFEVDEDDLHCLPVDAEKDKSPMQQLSSFWGRYAWPRNESHKFHDAAMLESAAAETSRMSVAFSELRNVNQLALAIDSGLGWLGGPHRSLRARILRDRPKVFGTKKHIPDRRAQAQRELWRYIESCYDSQKELMKGETIYRCTVPIGSNHIRGLFLARDQPEWPFLDSRLIREATCRPLFSEGEWNDDDASILFTAPVDGTAIDLPAGFITHTRLYERQEEWLLEIGWAQRAFMASYMLSIIDNRRTFEHVHTLNLARISCCYIDLLDRQDFWNALPMLANVTLRAIADFCRVYGHVGNARMAFHDASNDIDPFYALLRKRVVSHAGIKQLRIGWETGGEHAEGRFTRNRLLLPAPLLPSNSAKCSDKAVLAKELLVFPYVRDLAIENCWMTPAVLEQMVEGHDAKQLRQLTLDSVSLMGVLSNFGTLDLHAFPLALYSLIATVTRAIEVERSGAACQAWEMMQPHLQRAVLVALGQVRPQLQQQILQLDMSTPSDREALQRRVAELRTQLYQILHAVQAERVGPIPPINAQTVLYGPPRVGSWLYVLDTISPGLNLAHLGSKFSRANAERKSSLERITLKSCGYAELSTATRHIWGEGPRIVWMSQAITNMDWEYLRRYLTELYRSLVDADAHKSHPCTSALFANIVQEADAAEVVALGAAWNLKTGWEDSEAALGPEYDGLSPGGTGRFSGSINRMGRQGVYSVR